MKNKTQKTVLITGGAGYIGSACTKELCDEGYQVVVLDNLSNSDKSYVDPRAIFIEGDVLDMVVLENVFKKHRPHSVLHMAALKAVGESEEQPERYFRTNIVGTLNILSVAAECAVSKIIFSSTAAVYEPSSSGLHIESDPLCGGNVYGNTKLVAERLIQEFHRTGRLSSYTIFRYFNVIGDVGLRFVERNPQNLMPVLMKSLVDGTQFNIFGSDYSTKDGTCIRDYIHLKDIVRAHVLALKDEATGIFNLGTSNGKSVLDMIEAFERVSGKRIAFKMQGRRKGDCASVLAISTKAKEELGWEPESSLDDALASLLPPDKQSG